MSYVMIIDDEVDNAEILSIYLREQNLQSVIFTTGRNVLDYVIKHPPDLILMDVNLPDNDGRVLCRTIKDRMRNQAPPIIVMTAAGIDYKQAAMAMGADDFFVKPSPFDEIIAKINKHRNYHARL